MGLSHLLKFVFGTETGIGSAGVSVAKRITLNGKYSEFCLELSRHQHCLKQARECKDKDNKTRYWDGAKLHLDKANRLRAELIPLIDWFEQTGEPIPISEVVACVPREDFVMPERRKWWQYSGQLL